MAGKPRMRMTLTCASNFECWTFVAEAIVNCGVAAELRCKLEVGGYRTFEPSPKEYFQCRSVERCAPAHGFAPLHPDFTRTFGGRIYWGPKLPKTEIWSGCVSQAYSPLATTVLVADYRALGAVGNGAGPGRRLANPLRRPTQVFISPSQSFSTT